METRKCTRQKGPAWAGWIGRTRFLPSKCKHESPCLSIIWNFYRFRGNAIFSGSIRYFPFAGVMAAGRKLPAAMISEESAKQRRLSAGGVLIPFGEASTSWKNIDDLLVADRLNRPD